VGQKDSEPFYDRPRKLVRWELAPLAEELLALIPAFSPEEKVQRTRDPVRTIKILRRRPVSVFQTDSGTMEKTLGSIAGIAGLFRGCRRQRDVASNCDFPTAALSRFLRAHAKGARFFIVRFFRRTGRRGSMAGETPAAT
jgi:hypothetical protein